MAGSRHPGWQHQHRDAPAARRQLAIDAGGDQDERVLAGRPAVGKLADLDPGLLQRFAAVAHGVTVLQFAEATRS